MRLLVAIGCCLLACAPAAERSGGDESRPHASAVPLRHAEHFRLSRVGDATVLEIRPDGEVGASWRYVLQPGAESGPDTIRVPVGRVACVSTTHVALFNALDRRDVVAAMSWLPNLYDPQLRAAAAAGSIRELSRDGDIDLETLIDLDPDAVVTYLTADPEYGDFGKMRALGLPVVPNAEFREPTPLGQAEWIRFAGALLDMDRQASRYFDSVEARYLTLRDRVAAYADSVGRPTVFVGLDWKGTWSVPRGDAFAARFIADAGGAYLWADEPGAGHLALDFEAVFQTAAEADYWLHPGAARSREQMVSEDDRLRHFRAWSAQRVFNNDARVGPGGGNDYWESAVVRPDRVLEDLVRILHPERNPWCDPAIWGMSPARLRPHH